MNKKSALGMVSVIVLGAMGSGLWELVKPLLGWGWTGVLTIATLGLDSLRDGIYASAPAYIENGFVVGLTLICSLILIVGAMILASIQGLRNPPGHFAVSVFFPLLISMAFALTMLGLRSVYVVQLAKYATTLEVIASPHVSDLDLKKWKADYVRIKNRTEYLAYIEKLRRVIVDAGQQAPVREFF
jgi:hypothetical protein